MCNLKLSEILQDINSIEHVLNIFSKLRREEVNNQMHRTIDLQIIPLHMWIRMSVISSMWKIKFFFTLHVMSKFKQEPLYNFTYISLIRDKEDETRQYIDQADYL